MYSRFRKPRRILSRSSVGTRLLAVGSASLLLAGTAAACGSGGGSASGASVVTLCVDAAATGANAANGGGVLEGTKAWVHYINAKGGEAGHTFEVVAENDNSDPATAASVARKCVTQDDASFILGPEQAATAAAAVPVANQLKTVMVETGSGWSDIGMSKADQHGYGFPVSPDNFQANALAMVQDVIKPMHLTRVAVLQTDGPETGLVGSYTRSIAKRFGITVVSVQSAEPGATNDTPEALKMMQASPQAVVIGLTPGPDTLTGIRAIRALNPTIPIGLCTAACVASSFVSALGASTGMKNVFLQGSPPELVQNLAGSSDPYAKAAVADTRTYLAALKSAGYTSSDSVTQDFHGWQASVILGQAIKTAGSTDTAAVRKALQHQNITVGGAFGFAFKRTPQNYDNCVAVLATVDTVQPDGSLKIFKP